MSRGSERPEVERDVCQPRSNRGRWQLLRRVLEPWWAALRAVWWPFLLVRLGLVIWAAFLAVAVGSVDDYGKVTRAEWPPTGSWGVWSEQVLLLPWLHYDAHHYLKIVAEGFLRHPAGTVFYPGYPLSIRMAAQAIGHPLAAAMVVNLIAHLGLVVCLYRYVGEEFSPDVGRWTVVALLTFPLAFLFAAPYSEAPFLLFVVLAFWAGRRRKWLEAGIYGFFAAVFRQPGLLLFPALVVEWFLWALRERRWRTWLSGLGLGLILLPPYAFAFYLYAHNLVETFPLHPGSPFLWVGEIETRFWDSQFVMPWTTVEGIARQITRGAGGPFWIDLLWTGSLTVLALAALKVCYRPGPAVYTLLMLAASWSKVVLRPSASPIESFPRHMMVIFPVYLLLGWVLKHRPWLRPVWLVLSSLLLLFHSALFIRNAWIP